MTTGEDERGRGTRIISVAAAIATVVFLLVWPLANGVMLTNSAVVYGNRVAQGHREFDEILALSWAERWFRPVDMVYALLADPVTADSRASFLLQVPALIAILAGMALAMRRLVDRWLVPFALAVVWLGMHPSTMVSLWPGDSLTQTAVTAFGVWFGLLLWRVIDDLRNGAPVGRHVVIMTIVCVLGILMKEQFVGYCVGATGITILALALTFRRSDRAPLSSWMTVVAPLVVVPVVWIAIRYSTGGLAQITAPTDDRYRPAVGLNVVRNIALAGGGSFALGPTHMLFDRSAPSWVRALPLIGTGLSIGAAGLTWLLVLARRVVWEHRPSAVVLSAVVLMALCGAMTALPTQTVSELYLMGPNVGIAIAVAIGLCGLFNCRSSSGGPRPAWCLGMLILIGAGVFLVGLTGLASRSVHFRIVWKHAAALRTSVVAHQREIAPSEHATRIVVPHGCRAGRVFGQYVLPPSEALSLAYTEEWLNVQYPDRPVRFVEEVDAQPGDLVLDCSDLAQHPSW